MKRKKKSKNWLCFRYIRNFISEMCVGIRLLEGKKWCVSLHLHNGTLESANRCFCHYYHCVIVCLTNTFFQNQHHHPNSVIFIFALVYFRTKVQWSLALSDSFKRNLLFDTQFHVLSNFDSLLKLSDRFATFWQNVTTFCLPFSLVIMVDIS